jgi:hypothetical protein
VKHFRLALCFLAASSVALLLIALGRQTADPDYGRRQAAPASQVVPDSSPSVAATPGSEKADLLAASPEDRKEGPAAKASDRASVPAGGDDEPRHPGDRLDPAKLLARYGNRPLTTDHPDIKAAIQIQERNNRWLLAHPAVVGTAIGLNDDAEIALLVYTKVDAPELPKAVEQLPVATFRSGPFVARNRLTQDVEPLEKALPTARRGPPSPIDPTARFSRPVPIGVSTGHPDITAGTIGCRVIKNGAVYALSNNHVYANEGLADTGDAVIQPGTYDGGVSPADNIGTLAAASVIKFDGSANRIDAAIALSSLSNLGNSTPANGYGVPKSATTAADLNKKVKKYGRTTGQTTGGIGGLNAAGNIQYDGGVAYFEGQVIINGGAFSAGGDSGSLIVLSEKGANNGKPVALLFAGGGGVTIANPIDEVLAEFGVTIDGN